jgi:hypothetical protein
LRLQGQVHSPFDEHYEHYDGQYSEHYNDTAWWDDEHYNDTAWWDEQYDEQHNEQYDEHYNDFGPVGWAGETTDEGGSSSEEPFSSLAYI